jgi:hypothetical protein
MDNKLRKIGLVAVAAAAVIASPLALPSAANAQHWHGGHGGWHGGHGGFGWGGFGVGLGTGLLLGAAPYYGGYYAGGPYYDSGYYDEPYEDGYY